MTVFAALWAIATLFHQASYRLWGANPAELLLSVAAVLVLLSPGSLARFALLLGAQLAALWASMPYVANHWLFTGFMNLTMLLALAQATLRGRGRVFDRERLYASFGPVLRLELVLLYALAAFHKLNSDYLDTGSSCASFFLSSLATRLPWLPSGPTAREAFILGSLAVEIAIPLLLLWPSQRNRGIVLAALFHILLPLSPYPPQGVYNFSAMLFAAYFLFAPEGFVSSLAEWRTPARFHRGLPWIVGLGVWAVVQWPKLLWLVYSTTLLTLFVGTLAAARGRLLPVRPVVGLGQGVLFLPPLLLILSGLSPYLGLKTETSFAMFSNLRTEGGATNHLLLPRPLSVFGFQEDLVTIVESKDPLLSGYASERRLMTWFEFRSYAQQRKRLRVSFRRGGEPVRSIQRIEDDPRLMEPVSPLARKLLLFRPVVPDGPVACEH